METAGKLLDIGCATGLFFEYFGAPNWKSFGVEPCACAAEYARQRHGAEVFHGCLEECRWDNGLFDAITILDSLYYFSDPLAALVKANHLLKPDGILAVEIPGLSYKLLRERGPLGWLLDGKWSRLKPESSHFYHFSSSALGLLLSKAGFAILQTLPEQAPLRLSRVQNILSDLHFVASRFLFSISGGRVSIAAKEVYICRKR